MISLFVSVAAMGTAMAGASTVATLIASDAVGPGWSGVASASGIAGAAIGTLVLGYLMTRYGRRTGLVLAFTTAVVGALIAASAVLSNVFLLLLIGMLMVGFGNGGAQLARYAAAELYPVNRRGSALGTIVWAGTVGAVLGPSLIAPAAAGASALKLPDVAGTLLLAVIVTLVAGLAALVIPRSPRLGISAVSGRRIGGGIRPLLRISTVRLALSAMVCGQVAMVAVMTMTPVHLHQHGHGLATVGSVLTAHMIGMFALAPLSGRLADRFGGAVAITIGVGTLVLATVIAFVTPASSAGVFLMLSLFLLGYGWNLCFVGGSSLLSKDLPVEQRTRLQGAIDALVWGASAIASLLSGRLLAIGDYSFVALVGGVVALLPVLFMLNRRTT